MMDLNLLLAFRAIDETRHVTRAAKALGATQPALSQSLRRLREAFDDPLFVRTPRGMVPTPLAETLSAPIRDALARIEEDVLKRGPFRAGDLARTFRIRSTDYIEALLGPGLLEALAAEAPNVKASLLAAGLGLPKEELESGRCDLAIAGFFGELPDGFHRQLLFRDGYSCAVRRGHPALRGGSWLSLDAFCAERHVLVAPGGELTARVDRVLARQRRKRSVVLGASGFMAGAWLTARSDVVGIAPSRIVEMLAKPFGLVTFEPPVVLPPIDIVQVWHARSDADPAHRWFRALVKKLLDHQA